MNWKCKIGLHDWEIVEEIDSKAQLRENMKCLSVEMESGDIIDLCPKTIFRGFGCGPILKRKVCLRCEKYVDNITPIKHVIIDEDIELHYRSVKAKHILNIKD